MSKRVATGLSLPMRVNRLLGDVATVMPESTAARLWVELSATQDPELQALRAALGPVVLGGADK